MHDFEQSINLSAFFGSEYVDYASYDNVRKIASLIDGQKNAMRKIVYTIIVKNIKNELKVSQLSSKIEEFTEYLHGSIVEPLCNMGQDFAGTNNIPLVQKSGNFGTRYIKEPSAPRYINAYGSDALFNLFDKDDMPNLIKQYFEGNRIEPRFFVPTLPILLINGSEGVSSGFAQKILPRNPVDIKKLILNMIDGGKRRANLTPFYKGFNGVIEQGDNHKQWLIKGAIERISSSRFKITEIPVGYTLKQYLNVLDGLEDAKIISSYVDQSENDEFKFIVKVQGKLFGKLTDEQILVKMKLIKKVTENYTVMNHTNKITIFEDVETLAGEFLRVKKIFMDARKSSLVVKYENEVEIADSKYKFIKMITNDELIVNKRKKAAIVEDLETNNFYKVDDKYDYLLNLNIGYLTVEKMKELKEQSMETTQKLKTLLGKTPNDLLVEDIDQLKQF